MIDTHCHLTEPVLRDRLDEVIRQAGETGVSDFIVPAVNCASSKDALDLARGWRQIHAAAGIHPMWADFPDDDTCRRAVREIGDIASAGRGLVVAVGEIGLDAEPGADPASFNPATRTLAFRLQLELARDLGLPAIIHSRGPTAALVDMLKSLGPAPAGGVLHAFGGSAETMRELRELGYLRGVAGTVTRADATRLAAVIAATSVEDMLLETDAPFIANAAHRRGETVPSDMVLTVRAIAGLTGVSVEEVTRITDENARRIFGLRQE